MTKKHFAEIEKRAKKIEDAFGSLENFARISTNLSKGHRMKMEDKILSNRPQNAVFQEVALRTQAELFPLEQADLWDFMEFEEKFDGFSS